MPWFLFSRKLPNATIISLSCVKKQRPIFWVIRPCGLPSCQTKMRCAMPAVVCGSAKVLEVLSVCPRGRGFGSQQGFPRELVQQGLKQLLHLVTNWVLGWVRWFGMTRISCLFGMLGFLSAPMPCSVAPWLCKGCALMGKRVVAADCFCCQWIWPAPSDIWEREWLGHGMHDEAVGSDQGAADKWAVK